MNRFKFESFSTTVKGRCLEFEALKSGHIQPIILFFWYSRSQTFTAERLIAQISNTEQFWVHHCMSETHKSLNWETGQIIIISITVRQTAASWHIHNIHITYSTGLKTNWDQLIDWQTPWHTGQFTGYCKAVHWMLAQNIFYTSKLT